MRLQKWFVVVAVVSVVGLVVEAAEKPPANYQKAMQDLGTYATDIDKAVAAEDFDAIAALAISAREAFVVAEKYWNGKNAEAVQLAQIGGKQSADLVAVASQRSKEGAEFSAAEVKNVCEPCHAAHRGRQPDGTFLIK